MKDFQSAANSIREDVITWRRDFHQHPELVFKEVRTSTMVAQHLESLGMEVQRGIGIMEGDTDGPTVMVRCDMDALSIQEENLVKYASIITDGALENSRPDVLVRLQLWTDMSVGEVAILAGPDTFTITIKGCGRHAALPHLSVDPVMCMVQTISSLQTVVSRGRCLLYGAHSRSLNDGRGSKRERGLDYPHQHPRFDFDEEALVTGVAVLASAISEYVMA